jgi:predicted secreted protein
VAQHRKRELPARHTTASALAKIAGAALLLASSMLPAAASDMALADFIGFSRDLRYFAFEEYGIEDGSGSSYSSIYVIDLDEDRWIAGTPLRDKAFEDSDALAATREKVRLAARPKLAELGIDLPAQIAALSGDGMIDEAAAEMRFGFPAHNAPGATEGEYRLELQTFDLPPTPECLKEIEGPASGFALSLTTSGTTREIHRDTALPQSRGCPTAYRLYAILLPYWGGEVTTGVAIVSSYPRGFEGPDRRFLAVPLRAKSN